MRWPKPQKAPLLLLAALASMMASAQKLSLDLEPATDFQDALPNAKDRIFFRPTTTLANSSSCNDTFCLGAFTADLSQVDTLHITFRVPPGSDDLFLRTDAYDPRILVAFSARTANCTSHHSELLLSRKIKQSRVILNGTYTEELSANFHNKGSFVDITTCSIATNLEFVAPDEATVFEGNVSSILWKVALDNYDFKLLAEQTYWFSTDRPMWIQVPLPPPPEPTSGPTTAPTAGPPPTNIPMDATASAEEPAPPVAASGGLSIVAIIVAKCVVWGAFLALLG